MTYFNPYSETLFRGQTFKERKRDMTIEQSRASAMAAFRAGRVSGHREALTLLIEAMDERAKTAQEQNILIDLCEAVSALGKDEPTNDRNLPRDSALETEVMGEL